jgi:AAA ATPase domain
VLLERADELRALEAVLDTGGVLVVEGGAGIGKTSLLRHGAERARRRGWRPLLGTGSELETGFAFGVVRQLFERELTAADPGQRAEWLAGPAGAVRSLLAVPGHSAVFGHGAPEPFAVVHGLYWLTVNMAAGQPLLITVDDAHWADPASLRWLAYITSRLEGLAAAVVIALRPAEQASRRGPLAAVRAAALAIRPSLLSAAGAAVVVRAALGPGTPDTSCRALHEASGGNPFYLSELLRAQPPAGAAAAETTQGLPAGDAVTRHVEARIRRLDPAALGLAQALAVLGDEGQLRHAAAMTGLDMDAAVGLAAALVRAEILATADPPCFLHPVVRAATGASLGSDERHRAHRRAAAGRQTAAGWLAEALARTGDPRERAEIAHELARTYAALFRWVEAVDTTDLALAELGDRDPALAARLEAELAVAGMHDARRAPRVLAVMERLTAARPASDTAEALAVARGMAGVLTGQLTPEATRELQDALRAAEPAAANWDTRAALLWTLITAECFDVVEDALPAMIEAAGRGGTARGLIAGYSSLGFLKLRLGALPEADAAARVALRVLKEGDFTAGLGVAAIAAEVAVEAGELDEAQALLDLIAPGPAGVLSVLAPAARGRPVGDRDP